MNQIKGKCQYQPRVYSWTKGYVKGSYSELPDQSHAIPYEGCKEKVWKGGDNHRCVFHSHNEKGEKFYQRFKDLYKKNIKNNDEHRYIGFVFPKEFCFKKLEKELRKERDLEEREHLRFKDANFYDAEFLCPADFSHATFEGDRGTNFIHSRFRGTETKFTSAVFKGKGQVNFYLSQLTNAKDIKFDWAEFSIDSTINFSWATFITEGEIDFNNSLFQGDGVVWFDKSFLSCLNGVNFRRARFHKGMRLKFTKAVFDIGTILDFRELSFDNTKGVKFDQVNLSQCLFFDTDVRNIDFNEVTWNKWFNKKRCKTFDQVLLLYGIDKIVAEISRRRSIQEGITRSLVNKNRKEILQYILEKEEIPRRRKSEFKNRLAGPVNDKNLQLDILESIEEKERQLSYKGILSKVDVFNDISGAILELLTKKCQTAKYKDYLQGIEKAFNATDYIKNMNFRIQANYDNKGKFQEADDFFVDGMELWAKDRHEKRRVKIALAFYRSFSEYGVKPLLSVYWLLGTIFLFFILFLGGIEPFSMLNSFVFSLINVLPARLVVPILIEPSTISSIILASLENLIGLFFITLIALAMNRKFRRTKG